MAELDKETLDLIRASQAPAPETSAVAQETAPEAQETAPEAQAEEALQQDDQEKTEDEQKEEAPPEEKDPGPPENGPFELRNAQGQLMQRMHYQGGKKNGTFEIFSDDMLVQKGAYKEDLIEGPLEIFDHGKLIARVTYVGGKKHGLAQFFKDSCILVENTYKDEVLDGPTVTYYPGTKQRSMEAIYKDGVYEGVMSVYTDSGSLARVTEYTSGKRHGRCVSYYPNGALFEECFFAEDAPCGVTTQYYPDKTKKLERHFDVGGSASREVLYDASGKVVSDTSSASEAAEASS